MFPPSGVSAEMRVLSWAASPLHNLRASCETHPERTGWTLGGQSERLSSSAHGPWAQEVVMGNDQMRVHGEMVERHAS